MYPDWLKQVGVYLVVLVLLCVVAIIVLQPIKEPNARADAVLFFTFFVMGVTYLVEKFLKWMKWRK